MTRYALLMLPTLALAGHAVAQQAPPAAGVLGLLVGAAAGAASSGDSRTVVGAPVQITPMVIRGVPGIAMRVEF